MINGDTSTGTVNGPATEYIAGVRAALVDLPPVEVEEILDEVATHLSDLTMELGTQQDLAALTTRLGSPADYAAELRAAAGYPPSPAVTAKAAAAPRHTGARIAVLALVLATLLMIGAATASLAYAVLAVPFAVLGALLMLRDGARVPSVASLPEVRRLLTRHADGTPARMVIDFLASLQPGWWVVRALVAAALVGGMSAFTLLLAVVAVPISVWLGYRARRDLRLLWLVVPLNALAGGLLLASLVGVTTWGSPLSGRTEVTTSSPSGLSLDGREITDIRPVDATGLPLTDVYLFDQDGRMIDVDANRGCYDRSGASVMDPNSPYPRGTVDFDPQTGDCIRTPPAPLVVAVPTRAPATTSVPAPSPTTVPPVPGAAVPGAEATPVPLGSAVAPPAVPEPGAPVPPATPVPPAPATG